MPKAVPRQIVSTSGAMYVIVSEMANASVSNDVTWRSFDDVPGELMYMKTFFSGLS